MLEHGIHAGGEREVDDVDAMMHELYYECNPHVLQSATWRMRHWLVLQRGFERLQMAPIVFERKYGRPAESVFLST